MASRRVVLQESVSYAVPPTLAAVPAGITGAERVAWYEGTYADYPQWLALFIKGGWEFGGLATEQGALL